MNAEKVKRKKNTKITNTAENAWQMLICRVSPCKRLFRLIIPSFYTFSACFAFNSNSLLLVQLGCFHIVVHNANISTAIYFHAILNFLLSGICVSIFVSLTSVPLFSSALSIHGACSMCRVCSRHISQNDKFNFPWYEWNASSFFHLPCVVYILFL